MKMTLILLSVLVGVARADCLPHLAKFDKECQLSERFELARESLARFGVSVEEISEYRALRFIARGAWEASIAKGQPYPWLIYNPAPATWLQWEKGAQATDELIAGDNQITVDELESLHKAALTTKLMSFISVWIKGNKAGKIRSRLIQIPPLFKVLCENGGIDQKTHDLMMDYDLRDRKNRPLIRSSFKQCDEPGKYRLVAKYLASRFVPKEIQKWTEDFNSALQSVLDGTATESPMAMAADFQRRFVSIHPFGDGNGRMSRFVQDFFLRKIGLPLPASGDLQNDVFTPTEQYRTDFFNSAKAQVDLLERCVQEYQNHNVSARCERIYNEEDGERARFGAELSDFLEDESL
jgi:prophage maintenance system killer protein